MLVRLLFLSCVLSVGLGLSFTTRAEDCHLNAGWESWSPYQYILDSKLTGLDIELATEITSGAGCTVEFREMPWARHLKEIEEQRIDLAMGASKTPERAAFGQFSNPYRDERYGLFILRESLPRWGSIPTLQEMFTVGLRLGITRDYFYGDDFTAMSKEFTRQIDMVRNDANNLPKLQRGRIDGFLSDPVVMIFLINEQQLQAVVAIHPRITLVTGDIHLLLSRRVPGAVVEKLNASLQQLRENGRYSAIMNRYLGMPAVAGR